MHHVCAISLTPIANLVSLHFNTISFADIVGFTAWSSMREPSQVFALLEHIYSSFDAIAKRRHVFKVETIGDCYGKLAADVMDSPPHELNLMLLTL